MENDYRELSFSVRVEDAPANFVTQWDVYKIYFASTVYRGVTYTAWGTDTPEAIEKIISLIKSDKLNGVIRKEGDIVQ